MLLLFIVSFIQGRDVQFQEELSGVSMLAKLQDQDGDSNQLLKLKGGFIAITNRITSSNLWAIIDMLFERNVLIFKNVKI